MKCKNCFFLEDYWCEQVVDSPDEEMERECVHFKQKTNADRIRAMTDEGLVDFFHRQVGCGVDFVPCGVVCFGEKDCPCYTTEDCKKKIAEWLKQPAEEVDDG